MKIIREFFLLMMSVNGCHLYAVVYLQPKQTDEEGWKQFCLGERVSQGTLSSHADADAEAGLDYSKVGLNKIWILLHIID